MSNTGAQGVVSDDPLLEAPQGFRLLIERFTFPPAAVLASSGDWSSFKGVLLKLVFGTSQVSRVMGSGVMVAPGVAMAARHVIEPELEALMAEDIGLHAMAITTDGIEIWRVHQVIFQEGKDVALLTLRRASKLNQQPSISQVILSTRVPRIGETVSMCGFVADKLEHPDGRISGNVQSSIGTVIEHYIDGRDRCMLPGPCFAVGVGAPGGLSGGPVFDETGRLAGILSSSLGPSENDISFVSMIHPILVENFEPCWPPQLVARTSLLQYDPRLCEIEGADRIQPHGNGYAYSLWS